MSKGLFITLSSVVVMLLAGCQSTPLPDACYQKPESGHCRAAFTRYYFDQDRQQCRPFIWGGCDGTVPFDTEQACQQACEGAPSNNRGE